MAYAGPVLPGTSQQLFRATGQTAPTNTSSGQAYYGPAFGNPSQSASTGGNIGAGNNGGSNPPANNPPANTNPENDLINQIYGSTINDLNGQANTLQSNYGSIQGDINSQYNTSSGLLKSNLDQSNAGLDLTAQQGDKRQQDALTAARRLYNDLVQGGQQRFGGASSAGEAYSALTGRQLQQNNQQVTSQFNDFMGQVGLARTNIKSKYDDASAQLEQQKNMALSQAQRDFQDSMSKINSMKNEAGSNKAAAQLSALQNLRNQIYNINISTTQNSQALSSLKTQAESNLQDAISKFTSNTSSANNAADSFSQNTASPTNTLAFSGTPTYGQGQAQTGQVSPTQGRDQNWYDQSPFNASAGAFA